jgi:Tol biopolymer transport system component
VRAIAVGAIALALAGCAAGAPTIPAPKRLALVYRDRAGSLIVASLKGTDPRLLGTATSALLSPDGTRVAALSGDGHSATLTIYPTGKARRARLVATLAPPRWSPAGVELLGWSPDSRFIALSADQLSSSGEEDTLLVVNVDTGRVTAIAEGDFLGASFAPTLPDELTYADATIDQLDDNEALLYVTDADGRHTHAITHSGLASSPAWSARGIVFARLLALGSATSSPVYGLWLIQPDGHGLRRLGSFASGPPAPGVSGSAFALSASGKRLAGNFFSRYDAMRIDAWTVDLAARHPSAQVLAQGGDQLTVEGISRNGRRILVSTLTPGGNSLIESLSFNGKLVRTLAAEATDPSWNH